MKKILIILFSFFAFQSIQAQNTFGIFSSMDAGAGLNKFGNGRQTLTGRFSGNLNGNFGVHFTTRDRFTFELGIAQSSQRYSIKDKAFGERHSDLLAEVVNVNLYPTYFFAAGYTRPITDKIYSYGKVALAYNNVKSGSITESFNYEKQNERMHATTTYLGSNFALNPEFGLQVKTASGFSYHAGVKLSVGLGDVVNGVYRVDKTTYLQQISNTNDTTYAPQVNTITTDTYSSKLSWLGFNVGVSYDLFKSDRKEKKTKKEEIVFEEEPKTPKQDLSKVDLPERPQHVRKKFHVKRSRVIIEVFDGAVEDGDTISMKLNNNWILYKHQLTKVKKQIEVDLQDGKNVIQLYAHNLGRISPNTARVYVVEGRKRHVMTIRSTLGENGTIEVYYDSDRDKSKVEEEAK